ncbi:MAG: UMP kinase [Fimbriimonadaceae bacterium]|nr:UMP kinase [Armatimonadota bacterium]
MSEIKYSRVLLKISGEALGGKAGFGLETETLDYIAQEIAAVHNLGVQVCVVVGGGNFIRGSAFSVKGGIDRTVADHMGMMGTVMNGLALQSAIENAGVPTRVQSAITISEVAEPFIRRRAVRHMEKGRVVVFAAGTGNPYFTTDTAAVLRALETDCEVLMKATKVDGIYNKDPKKHDDAVKYDHLTFDQAISEKLGVMDQTAFTMCQENKLSVVVLDMGKPGGMSRVVKGEIEGTLVTSD